MLLQQRQKGMTFLGYVIVLGVIGFFALMLLKLTPLYLEYRSVVSIMNGVAAEFGPTATPIAIRSTIGKRLDVNDVDRVDEKDFKLAREKGELVLSIEYQAETPFVGNLHFMLKFDHSVVLRGR